MSFYKEVPGRQTTLESTLKFDTEPKEGSTNPVTSDGVKSAIDGAVGDASAALQEQIDEIAEKAGSGYIPKGEATVATLNGLSGQENGDLYTMTDAGTLTLGSLAVVAGDTVAWDATNEVWYKAMDYATRKYGTNEVHNLSTSIAAFRTGDYIAVDGTDTAKMSKDDLLRVTAENAEKFSLISDGNVLNGKVRRYRSGNSDITHVYQKGDDGSFLLQRTSSGNTWSYYATPFTPDYTKKIKISFKVETTANNTYTGAKVTVYVSSGSGSVDGANQIPIASNLDPNGEVNLDFNASDYSISWTNCNVWVAINGANGYVTEVKVSDLYVYQKIDQVEYRHFEGDTLKQILGSLDKFLVDGNVMDSDKRNGKYVVVKEGNSDIAGAYQKNPDGSFLLQRTSSGNNWSSYNTAFVPDFSALVKIKFKVEVTANNTNPNVKGSVYVSNGRQTYAVGECIPIFDYDPSMGEVSLTFDPSYYQIYMSPPWTQFNVWVTIQGAADLVSELKISELKIYQQIGEVSFDNFGGETAKELLEGIDNALTGVSTSDKSVMVAPNGTKYLLAVNNDGSISTIPAVPSKCVYFGNSLLLGSGTYGLTASDDEHDYYYLINNYIQSNVNNSFTAAKYSGVSFEGITNPANVDSTINTMLQNLAGDEDLVVVQLGDNVNTAEKVAVFENSARKLLQAIRTKCSSARVVWFGMWYGSSEKYAIIQDACRNTGCELVSMSHVDKEAGRSYIGAVQKKPFNDYTLSDVSSVEDVGGGYIHITFSVSGNEYTSEIPVNSWSLVGTTLSYNGEYTIVNTSGVASHPGDVGMKEISNLFLFQLGYSSSATPIP